MFRKYNCLALMILALALLGCDIRTPEIRGVVLDEETKQPIENAWVHSSIDTESKTIQGPVETVWRVEPPHTRTNKKGEFVIPSRNIEASSFPFGIGREVKNFSVSATTIGDKSGGMYIKDFKRKSLIEVTILVKTWEGTKNEREYFSYIQSIFSYCYSGRIGIEVPPVDGGCDDWELNLAIAKHEHYLKEFMPEIQRKGYSNAFGQLAELYEKRKDIAKSVEILRMSIEVMENKGLLKFKEWQDNKKGIEGKISRLENMLKIEPKKE
jgi:hypothetical protein